MKSQDGNAANAARALGAVAWITGRDRLGFGFLGAQRARNPPAMQETWVQSLDQEDPLKEGMATHSSILAWRIPMDRGAWWATVHRITESDTTE